MAENVNTDSELVERAKAGDREAFGLLIQRHRAKAVNWAKAIVKDGYFAEDVAQGAILRSFLRLETLENSDRFLPWLRNIVRRKAIDFIRKSTSYRRLVDEGDWERISDGYADPETSALHRDWIHTVSELTRSLTERNRLIFESHFFRQLPPEEIAKLHDTTVSNVYNILSRSKVRLQEEMFRHEVNLYVKERNIRSKPTRQSLRVPSFRSPYTSLGHVLYEMLNYTKLSDLSISQVMGLTGQAFRIQMTPDAGLSSSLIYDWGFVFEQAARVFGFRAEHIGKPNRVPTPGMLIRALETIQASIEAGIPALVWNLTSCEFGMIYGYDDEKQTFIYRDASRPSVHVPYKNLGRSADQPELFVAALGPPAIWSGLSEREVRLSLEIIVAHARGKEPAVPGYVSGLAAYDVWMEALQGNRAEPIANAYNVASLTEARQHAVQFLEFLSSHRIFNLDSVLGEHLHEVVDRYRTVYRLYPRIYPSFPYGLPSVRIDNREHSVNLLRQIKAEEERGIERLEKILEILRKV